MIIVLILLLFSVGNVFAQETPDIRDIHPPVNFPFNFLPLIIIGVILFIAALIFLIIFFLKKRKKKKIETPQIMKSAYEIACEALQTLKAKNLPSQGKIKQYYVELSDIVRHYIENQLSIRAPEMTTEEFLFHLKDSGGLSLAHKDLLKAFLNQCDMVKFARYGPSQAEIEESFIRAKRFIDEAKTIVTTPKEVLV